MSAWIVSKEHIDVLVKARNVHRGRFWSEGFDPDELGRMLWRENLRSLQARYPNDNDGDRPGPIAFRDADVDEYVYTDPRFVPTPGEILQAISCYRYQSCEHAEWETSQAHDFCRDLMDAVCAGLAEGPWGWEADDIAKRRGLVSA